MSSAAKCSVAGRAADKFMCNLRFLTAKMTVNRISFALKPSIHRVFRSSLMIEWE